MRLSLGRDFDEMLALIDGSTHTDIEVNVGAPGKALANTTPMLCLMTMRMDAASRPCGPHSALLSTQVLRPIRPQRCGT